MGAREGVVKNMLIDNDTDCNDKNQIRKSSTHYFKHGCVVFRKSSSQSSIHFSVWVWIKNGTKLILRESGIIKEN